MLLSIHILHHQAQCSTSWAVQDMSFEPLTYFDRTDRCFAKKKECQNVERKSCHVSNHGEKQLVMLAWSAYEVSDFHLTGC
jgi:hypothetical protein